MWREVVIMRDVMVLYDNGEHVTTSDGRGPGYRGCLNDFDRAIIDMVNTVRSVTVLTVNTIM
jgi:hypothetical protein